LQAEADKWTRQPMTEDVKATPDPKKSPEVAAQTPPAPKNQMPMIGVGASSGGQAQQESERRLSLAMEGAGIGTWDIDPRTGESVWSATRFRNFGLQPIAGGHATLEMWFAQIHPDDLARVKEDIERAKRDKSFFSTAHRIIRADNHRVIWLQPFGRFYYDSSGQAIRFIGVSFDDTARKSAEELLKLGDRNKDQFLATLAHELRNPLSPLRNSLEVLRQGKDGDGSKERSTAIMNRQVNRLTRLVDDLLDVTRINQGKIGLQRDLVDLRDIVPAAAESVEHQIFAQGLKLNISLPAKPVYVSGDASRLEQVLANLLTNAAKYTERDGSIDVNLQAKGNEVILRVSDTGIGISPNELSTIFDLFTQGNGDVDRARGGLGIGLSLVRQLVQLHGGTVEATSAGVGKGSVFVIRLPLLSPSQVAEARKRATKEATSPPSLPPQRILIVDDNVDAADSLSDVLNLYGHDVRVAYEGHAALEQAREFAPRIVLLDIGLPGMDGNEVCRKLLQRPETKKAIIVALTGYGNEEAYYRSKEAGFHSHLLKPVNTQDLLQILGKLVMRAGKHK
jgi:signal transduction histidine kinase/ActR/RegA family two-component response regulator